MQVSVKMMPMNAMPVDMNQIKKKINACMLELEQVRRDLGTLSGLDDPIIRIKKCEKELESQARYCMLFGNTISQVCMQYKNTETGIIDYSENVRGRARRESPNVTSLKELYPLFHEVFFTKGGNGVGD